MTGMGAQRRRFTIGSASARTSGVLRASTPDVQLDHKPRRVTGSCLHTHADGPLYASNGFDSRSCRGRARESLERAVPRR